jgi:hypothetical protein
MDVLGNSRRSTGRKMDQEVKMRWALISAGIWFTFFGAFCLIRKQVSLLDWVRWYRRYPHTARLFPRLLGLGALMFFLFALWTIFRTASVETALPALAVAAALGLAALSFGQSQRALDKLLLWIERSPRRWGTIWITVGAILIVFGALLKE